MSDEKPTSVETKPGPKHVRIFMTLEVSGLHKDAVNYMSLVRLGIEGDLMFINAMWSLKKKKTPKLKIHEISMDESVQQ